MTDSASANRLKGISTTLCHSLNSTVSVLGDIANFVRKNPGTTLMICLVLSPVGGIAAPLLMMRKPPEGMDFTDNHGAPHPWIPAPPADLKAPDIEKFAAFLNSSGYLPNPYSIMLFQASGNEMLRWKDYQSDQSTNHSIAAQQMATGPQVFHYSLGHKAEPIYPANADQADQAACTRALEAFISLNLDVPIYPVNEASDCPPGAPLYHLGFQPQRTGGYQPVLLIQEEIEFWIKQPGDPAPTLLQPYRSQNGLHFFLPRGLAGLDPDASRYIWTPENPKSAVFICDPETPQLCIDSEAHNPDLDQDLLGVELGNQTSW